MNRLVYFLAAVILWTGCVEPEPYPGYTELGPDGVYFKVLSFNEEGQHPNHGDMLRFRMGLVEQDSLVWLSEDVQAIRYDTSKFGLKSALHRFHVGDSLSLLLEPAAFRLEFAKSPVRETGVSDLRLKIIDVISEKKWLSAKNLDRGVKLKREQDQIAGFMANHPDSAQFEFVHGMWQRVMTPGNGGHFNKDENLLVMFEATLLDGTVIDQRLVPEDALSYSIGMQGQLIPGLMTAIRYMDRNEHLEIILPSEIAFGERGSAGDIVPPWTPLRYVLEVVAADEASQVIP